MEQKIIKCKKCNKILVNESKLGLCGSCTEDAKKKAIGTVGIISFLSLVVTKVFRRSK